MRGNRSPRLIVRLTMPAVLRLSVKLSLATTKPVAPSYLVLLESFFSFLFFFFELDSGVSQGITFYVFLFLVFFSCCIFSCSWIINRHYLCM